MKRFSGCHQGQRSTVCCFRQWDRVEQHGWRGGLWPCWDVYMMRLWKQATRVGHGVTTAALYSRLPPPPYHHSLGLSVKCTFVCEQPTPGEMWGASPAMWASSSGRAYPWFYPNSCSQVLYGLVIELIAVCVLFSWDLWCFHYQWVAATRPAW